MTGWLGPQSESQQEGPRRKGLKMLATSTSRIFFINVKSICSSSKDKNQPFLGSCCWDISELQRLFEGTLTPSVGFYTWQVHIHNGGSGGFRPILQEITVILPITRVSIDFHCASLRTNKGPMSPLHAESDIWICFHCRQPKKNTQSNKRGDNYKVGPY